METQPNLLLGLLPFVLFAIPTAVVANLLARDKGRNVGLWTLVGVIPLVGLFCLWYFVGASNLRVERKLDELLRRLQA